MSEEGPTRLRPSQHRSAHRSILGAKPLPVCGIGQVDVRRDLKCRKKSVNGLFLIDV